MERILTKAKFYELFKRGVLGNHGPQWDTYEEYLKSEYKGKIAIRSRQPGGRCDYWLTGIDAVLIMAARMKAGESESNFHFSAMAPDDNLKLQGYVCRSIEGLYLYYNDIPGYAMRDGLSQFGKYAFGLKAKCLLEWACDPSSYDWIMDLLDRFDGIVEFGAYNQNWGHLPYLNTVIWEVRNY